MTREDYAKLLNLLLECERAGAKLLATYCEELPPGSEQRAWLGVIQRDEARNCAVLIRLLREQGAEPSLAVGDFYRKGLEVRGWSERLAFLNRGQQWVARRIAAALPEISQFAEGRRSLGAMLASHLLNIHVCEELI
jgi:hypothetical protein